MTGYYDIVLGVIPLSLAGLTALLLVGGMSLSVAIPLASVVTIGVMGHAMFVNAPEDPVAPEAPATNESSNTPGFTAD